MGKVNGVVTGVRECHHERVVLADDDVRYDAVSLRRALALLGETDLVRPQNYFDELPWHARWDTARVPAQPRIHRRSRLSRRRLPGHPGGPPLELFLASGAYDGDALFENLELMRTIARGRRNASRRRSTSTSRGDRRARAHFLSQRVRQAYDDLAMPARLCAFLVSGPLATVLLRRGRRRRLGAAALAAVAVAETGRRRAGGGRRFPLSGSLLAPAWIAERSLCSWLALGARLRGGVRYGEGRLPHAATSMRQLQRRYAESGSTWSSGNGTESPLSARKRVVL